MRLALIATVAALAFAPAASLAGTTGNGSPPTAAQTPAGPYHLTATGKCQAANGQLTYQRLCVAPVKRCRNSKTGGYVPCGSPGAVGA